MARVVMWAALLLVVRPAAAQVELKWKWREGEIFFVQTVTKIKQTVVIEDPRGDAVKPRSTRHDREIKQSYEYTSWLQYTVKKRNEDGSAILLQRVEPDRAVVKGEETSQPDPTLDGIELTLHIDAKGQVTKAEGGDKLLERLAGGDTARRAALKEMLSPETLRGLASQSLGVLPGSRKKSGETWNSTSELKLGALGAVKAERVFALDAVETRGATVVARLSFTTKLTNYQPAQGAGTAFQIAAGTLTEASGKGTAEADLDAGRLLGSESTMKLAGTLALRNAEVLYRARLVQEQTVTTKVTDKLPAKEVPKK